MKTKALVPVNLKQEFDFAQDLVQTYIDAVKGVDVRKKTRLNVEGLMEEVIRLGETFIVNEKLYKVAQGMIFSALKQTTTESTYKKIADERFRITPQTADRYALIYEAWFSGQFLYSVPDDCNIFELTVKDLEYGAQLIVDGHLTEHAAETLFSPSNDWMEKRDLIRETVNGAVKRNGKRLKKVKQEPRLRISADGDIFFKDDTGLMRIGVLYITDTSAVIRGTALRAKEAVEREFKRNG